MTIIPILMCRAAESFQKQSEKSLLVHIIQPNIKFFDQRESFLLMAMFANYVKAKETTDSSVVSFVNFLILPNGTIVDSIGIHQISYGD